MDIMRPAPGRRAAQRRRLPFGRPHDARSRGADFFFMEGGVLTSVGRGMGWPSRVSGPERAQREREWQHLNLRGPSGCMLCCSSLCGARSCHPLCCPPRACSQGGGGEGRVRAPGGAPALASGLHLDELCCSGGGRGKRDCFSSGVWTFYVRVCAASPLRRLLVGVPLSLSQTCIQTCGWAAPGAAAWPAAAGLGGSCRPAPAGGACSGAHGCMPYISPHSRVQMPNVCMRNCLLCSRPSPEVLACAPGAWGPRVWRPNARPFLRAAASATPACCAAARTRRRAPQAHPPCVVFRVVVEVRWCEGWWLGEGTAPAPGMQQPAKHTTSSTTRERRTRRAQQSWRVERRASNSPHNTPQTRTSGRRRGQFCLVRPHPPPPCLVEREGGAGCGWTAPGRVMREELERLGLQVGRMAYALQSVSPISCGCVSRGPPVT